MRLEDMTKVYFACTGNTCRSPMAQRILMAKLEDGEKKGISVYSRRATVEEQASGSAAFQGTRKRRRWGSDILEGSTDLGLHDGSFGAGSRETKTPISKGSEAIILLQYGDAEYVANHAAKGFQLDELEQADLIITMSRTHKDTLMKRAEAFSPDKRLKVYTLGELIGQPDVDVGDPFGSDTTLLQARYQQETGKSSGEDSQRDGLLGSLGVGLKDSSLEMEKHFGAERVHAIRAEAYMPTFVQLDAMITQLLDIQELPLVTFDDIYKAELTQRYETWTKERVADQTFSRRIGRALHRINPFRAKEETARTLFEATNYLTAFREMRNEGEELITTLERVAKAYQAVASHTDNTKVSTANHHYKSILQDTVMPTLFFRGGYLSSDWKHDRTAVERDLIESLNETALLLPTLLKETKTREGAFAVKEMTESILAVAHLVCSDGNINRIYTNTLGLPFYRDVNQDEINKRYSKLEDHSITHFRREFKAYRFTNEPLGDLLDVDLNLAGPVLTVTASGDIVCLLAGKGAKDIVAVDVSRYANAWVEHKFKAFCTMPYSEFERRFMDYDATWKTFPFDLPVSSEARTLFEQYKGVSKRLVATEEIFQNQGFAASDPQLTGFRDRKTFERLQQHAQKASLRFYPVDIVALFREEQVHEGYFSTAYLSNVLDHVRDVSGERYDFSSARMIKVVQPIVDHLRRDGNIVVNLQWGNRVKDGLEAALCEFDFRLETVPNKCGGCGYMYVARR